MFFVCVLQGNTALHLAAWNGHPESAKLLLDAGADKNLLNAVRWRDQNSTRRTFSLLLPKAGNTPEGDARQRKHSSVADLIRDFKPADVRDEKQRVVVTDEQVRGASAAAPRSKNRELASSADVALPPTREIPEPRPRDDGAGDDEAKEPVEPNVHDDGVVVDRPICQKVGPGAFFRRRRSFLLSGAAPVRL